MPSVIRVNTKDNVAILLERGSAGDTIHVNGTGDVTLLDSIEINHKLALCDIKKGEQVIKYGYSIGVATQDIRKGQWIHSHNLGE